jgi:hypothetical protein
MRALLLSFLALTSVLAAGCAVEPADDTDFPAGAHEQQIDTGWTSVRRVTMTLADRAHTPFATVIMVSRATGTFQPGVEYWYVNRDAVSLLGGAPLDITTTDYSTGGLEDPHYRNEQTFSQIQFPTSGWGSGWTSDPLSGGKLLGDGVSTYVRVTADPPGENVTDVAWYQIIPATQSPRWLTPSGRFSPATGVYVPTGYLGYDIDQPAR